MSIYQVAVEERPDDSVWETVGGGLFQFNHDKAGLRRTPPIAIIIRDQEKNIKGGLFGNSDWDVFNIDTVWISDEVRGQGFGKKLMQLGEDTAIHRGCKIAVVSTLSFQARGFYEKQGYKVFGELNGYPAGHSTYWLSKKLV
jgi:ribosomal protein S18 acetylase RimI-like enzyme